VRRTSVLIVEDDAALRALYRVSLKAAGYEVIAVEDGVDALRQVELMVPSAVVLDLELPRLSGRDVQRELASRADTAAVPVVVVTGTDTRDLDEADFACILRKPIHPEVLVYAIENCLRGGSRLT
jgi:DNA-binding response OmpR family regulator